MEVAHAHSSAPMLLPLQAPYRWSLEQWVEGVMGAAAVAIGVVRVLIGRSEADVEEAEAQETGGASFAGSTDTSSASAPIGGGWHRLVGPQTRHPRRVSEWCS